MDPCTWCLAVHPKVLPRRTGADISQAHRVTLTANGLNVGHRPLGGKGDQGGGFPFRVRLHSWLRYGQPCRSLRVDCDMILSTLVLWLTSKAMPIRWRALQKDPITEG